MFFIFTKTNADANGRVINQLIDNFVKENKNSFSYSSLGTVKYLSALKYCSMVIGNSSSGLIEAPSFGIPTINIGDRQKGRMQADSVINCEPVTDEIDKAIQLASSKEFREKARKTKNPYGDGNTSVKIVSVILKSLLNDKIDLKKKFFDIAL